MAGTSTQALSMLVPEMKSSNCASRLLWGVVTNPVLITKYYSDNQTEKKEMVGARSTYGEQERCIQDFGGEA
jgi:hypothetical protein